MISLYGQWGLQVAEAGYFSTSIVHQVHHNRPLSGPTRCKMPPVADKESKRVQRSPCQFTQSRPGALQRSSYATTRGSFLPYWSWLETQSSDEMAAASEISPASTVPATISANLLTLPTP